MVVFLAKLLGLLAALLFLSAGLLMITSPRMFYEVLEKYYEFLERFTGIDRYSVAADSGRALSRGQELSHRFAGIMLTGMGLLFLVGILAVILVPLEPVASAPPKDTGFSWYLLVTGVVMGLGGLYVIIKPLRVVQFFLERRASPRMIRDDAIPKIRFRARLLGAMMVVGGFHAIISSLMNL